MQILEFTQQAIHNIVKGLPHDLRDLMIKNSKESDKLLFLGGGFIRSSIMGETPNDIDLFGPDKEFLELIATKLVNLRLQEGQSLTKLHKTRNAFTVLTPGRMPVQLVYRWLFNDPVAMMLSFDFTMCQSVIYWADGKAHGGHVETFYQDIATKSLIYTAPDRNEDAGGSMLRVTKLLRKGWYIDPENLGKVMSRVFSKVNLEQFEASRLGDLEDREGAIAKVVTSLLRQVDPLTIIDGVDIQPEDHEFQQGQEAESHE